MQSFSNASEQPLNLLFALALLPFALLEQATMVASRKMKGLGVGDIGPVALSVGVAVIIVGVVAMVLAQMNTNISDANATYVFNKGLTALTTFADWFVVIIIVVVSVIILALVMLLRGMGGGKS